MKPDYKNWIPKGMLFSLIAGTVLSFALLLVFCIFGIGVGGKLRVVLGVVFGIAFVVCAKCTQWCVYAYRSFSYDDERKLSKQIIDGTAEHITLPEGGVGLDIGCGSGALTIACAKRNPQGKMIGIDRWGKEYASFSLPLCEKNAAAEGVKNASFRRGNAVKLDFPDESFDAVISNYVYHNIAGKDKQALLLETLRVLKKGGTYAAFAQKESESISGNMRWSYQRRMESGEFNTCRAPWGFRLDGKSRTVPSLVSTGWPGAH